MKLFIQHIITDYDNKTFDTGRVIGVTVILSMIFFEGYDILFHSGKFDPQAYGTGVAAVLGGLGAYIYGDNAKRPEEHHEEEHHEGEDNRGDDK